MTSLRVLIEERLRSLQGQRLMAVWRAADMAMFDFKAPGLKPEGHSLHVQCPWRLEGPRGIITGRADLWQPADPEDPAWVDSPGDYEKWRSLQDARLQEFHETTAGDGAVLAFQSVSADDSGGVVLQLAGGYRLLLFPASSRQECWRFFRPRTDEPHFVVPPETEVPGR